MKKSDEVLTVPEVCAMLGIHKTTAYNLIHGGLLPAFSVGTKRGGIRVLLSEVQKYKKKNVIKVSGLI